MDSIDIYCERVGPAFWSEPVNALTNLSFLVSAWALWRLAQRGGGPSPVAWALIAVMAAIGLGSFAFHTFATPWALVLDVVPILIFQLLFLWLYGRLIVGWPHLLCALAVAGFLAAALLARDLPAVLNGSLRYAPALLLLIAIGICHARTAGAGRHDLLAAAGVLMVSLTFRTIDDAVCPAFPLGTHFLWHLLNGLVLYLAARPLVLHGRR